MKRHFVTLIFGFIFVIVGSILLFFNIFNYKYIDEPVIAKEDLTLKVTNREIIDNTICQIYLPEYYRNKIKVVYDDSLVNTYKINTYYNDEFYQLDFLHNESYNDCSETLNITPKKNNFFDMNKDISKLIIKSLKNKEIYNYGVLFIPSFEIHVSLLNKDKIFINYSDDIYEFNYGFYFDMEDDNINNDWRD